MKTVEIFILPNCPYCVKAKRAVKELVSENEAYSRVSLKWINEAEEADYADEHDYYYVPSVYYDRHKFYEAHPGDSLDRIKDGIRTALDKAVYDGPDESYIDSLKTV